MEQLGIGGGDLDWFLFETRMRSLVRDIVEPVIERNEMEAERYLYLERKVSNLLKRLGIVEFALNIAEQPTPKKTVTMSFTPSQAEIEKEASSTDKAPADEEPPKPVPTVFDQIFARFEAIVRNALGNCVKRRSNGGWISWRQRTGVHTQKPGWPKWEHNWRRKLQRWSSMARLLKGLKVSP